MTPKEPPARPAPPSRAGGMEPTTPDDKVCVRDLVLPARIGIWSEEQGIAQRVRFTVELSIAPGGHRPGDPQQRCLRTILSSTASRKPSPKGHVLLTETIAERIAAHCLLGSPGPLGCASWSRSSTASPARRLAARLCARKAGDQP